MKCPHCQSEDHSVLATRSREGYIHRRRVCDVCHLRWSSHEITQDEHSKLLWIQEQYAKLRSLLEDQL